MGFLKKLFGAKQNNNGEDSSAKETFTCENCDQERPLSQKKAHMAQEGEKPKNVCEFC